MSTSPKCPLCGFIILYSESIALAVFHGKIVAVHAICPR